MDVTPEAARASGNPGEASDSRPPDIAPAEVKGRCARCERPGVVGERCMDPPCEKRGYHFIPAELVPEGVELDPRIGKRFDRYLLLARLGSGGFGTVYRAVNTALAMTVALKILTAEPDAPERRMHLRMFKNEALALAQLSHPNIVRLIDAGVEEHVPFIVMEYIGDARTLKAELAVRAARGEKLACDDARRFLLAVTAALDAAHAARIIHRDIKPDNIMIQSLPGHPAFVRVLDLGLAKFVGDSSRSQWAVGTPRYMAPEQLWAEGLGPWTDLYAVGVLAFELMTGRSPFGRAPAEIIAHKQDPSFDVFAAVAGLNLPVAVRAFIDKALAFSTANRFRSAADLRVALEAAYDAIVATRSPALIAVDLTYLVALDDESGFADVPASKWSTPMPPEVLANEPPASRESQRPHARAARRSPRGWRSRMLMGLTAAALVVVPVMLTSGSAELPTVDDLAVGRIAEAPFDPAQPLPDEGVVATVVPPEQWLTSETAGSLEEEAAAMAALDRNDQRERDRESSARRAQVSRGLAFAKSLVASGNLARAGVVVQQVLALQPRNAGARALAEAIATDGRWLRRLAEIGALPSPAEQLRALNALASPPPGTVAAQRKSAMIAQVSRTLAGERGTSD